MSMIKNLLLLLILTGAVSNVATAQSSTQPASEQHFIGIWRLVSWTKEYDDGTTAQEPRSESYIIYTETGHMCWVAMDPRRPNLPAEPTEIEEAVAFRGLGAYCATVEINLDDGYVIHHVEIAKMPNAVGIERKRWFSFDGSDRLHLRVDPTENILPLVESSLIWERIK